MKHAKLSLVTLLFLGLPPAAQTVTVNTVADVIDIAAATAMVADLPGPDGLVSLSEAMIATNNTPGHQTVAFAIPASQLGWCCTQYNGVAVFHSSVGFYWRANDEVTIDGTTQTAFAGDTNPSGNEVLIYSKTFYLNVGNSTLRGFHGSSIQAGGSNTLIEQNTGSMNITLFGGGGSVLQQNECGTIKIDRSNDNVVVGNTAQRVRVLGGGSSQFATGNRIGGPAPGDRNILTGYGSYNSEGLPSGAAIQLSWTQGTWIENNSIGTTADGLSQGNQACTMGINFQAENHDTTVQDNRIAGILGKGMGPHHAGQLFGWAIYFWGSTTNILIEGNTIGLDANGDPTLGSVWGVNVDNFSGYSVDGVQLVDNVIAGHILDGVRVGPTATMRITGCEIYGNGWLGVDLIPDNFSSGVSPNDELDLDDGGNGVQNYPELASATSDGLSTQVTGQLSSSPTDAFELEFFATSVLDPTGFGQAELFLGSTSVTTAANGTVAFDATLPVATPSGWFVTATATLEPLGATSEFAAGIPALEVVCQTDLGFQGPGASQLSVCGDALAGGGTAVLRLEGAAPLAPTWLALSATSNPTQFFGGMLVPVPPLLLNLGSTDGTGTLELGPLQGGGGPFSVYVQAASLDLGLPQLVALSNALELDFLP